MNMAKRPLPKLNATFKVTDTFQWDAASFKVSSLVVASGPSRAVPLTVRVTTAAASAKLPDLSPFALAPMGADASWRVKASGPMTTVDDFAVAAPPTVNAQTPKRAVTP